MLIWSYSAIKPHSVAPGMRLAWARHTASWSQSQQAFPSCRCRWCWYWQCASFGDIWDGPVHVGTCTESRAGSAHARRTLEVWTQWDRANSEVVALRTLHLCSSIVVAFAGLSRDLSSLISKQLIIWGRETLGGWDGQLVYNCPARTSASPELPISKSH